MANVDTNQAVTGQRRGFAGKRKQNSLRMDMTPMVDLGFLLITFFIFTSTLSEPNSMHLFMPKDDGAPTLIPQSGAFNIIVSKDGMLFYYEGLRDADNKNVKKASLKEIRKEIIRKKQDVIARYKPDKACETKAVAIGADVDDCRQKDLVILIKPTTDADYKTIVAVLDEMAINKIARYTLAEPDTAELSVADMVK